MDEVSLTLWMTVIYREISHRRDAEEIQRDLHGDFKLDKDLAIGIAKCKVMEITNQRTTMRI